MHEAASPRGIKDEKPQRYFLDCDALADLLGEIPPDHTVYLWRFGDHEGFFVEHFIKDMGIALEESRKLGLSMPGLALGHQLYLAVQAQGYGREGTHALELALAQISGIDWKNRA